MSFFQRVVSLFASKQKDTTISFLGPSKSGKTTLIRFLETGEVIEGEMLSTLGVDYRSKPIKKKNLSMNLIDVGGQEVYQNAFWEFAVEQSEGIVYIIDATIRPESNPQVFEKHKAQFDYILNILPEDTVVMILLNKQDLAEQNPMSPVDFGKHYTFTNLAQRSFTVLPLSAKFGIGVDEAFDWFIEAIRSKS